MLAFLVQRGHSWYELKTYPLSLVGAFFASAVRLYKEEQKKDFLVGWLAAHASKPDQVLKEWDGRGKRSTASPEQVSQDVKRFISFFSKMNRGKL